MDFSKIEKRIAMKCLFFQNKFPTQIVEELKPVLADDETPCLRTVEKGCENFKFFSI